MKNKCYELLLQFLPQLPNKPEYIKMKSEGMMDLNMDLLSHSDGVSTIALSHYYKHPSGDLIADPDMVIVVDFNKKTVSPLTYQDAYVYQDVLASGDKNLDLEKQLQEFLLIWLTNLNNQDYHLANTD